MNISTFNYDDLLVFHNMISNAIICKKNYKQFMQAIIGWVTYKIQIHL